VPKPIAPAPIRKETLTMCKADFGKYSRQKARFEKVEYLPPAGKYTLLSKSLIDTTIIKAILLFRARGPM